MMEYILLGAFVIFFVVFLFGGMIRAQIRTEAEKDKTPQHKETVGGTVGSTRHKGPMISLRIYDEFLVVATWTTHVFTYDQIDSVELVAFLANIVEGIAIVHHKPDAPKVVYLRVGDPARVKELIESKLAKSIPAPSINAPSTNK